MKIGINGRFLVAKQTGVQRAAYNLVKTLVSVDSENEYYLFTGNAELKKTEWDSPNLKVIGFNLKSDHSLYNVFWEQIVLPRQAKAYGVDILHSPANMAPIFYKGRSIIHIHDVCFVVNPQWYSFAFRTWYNWTIPRLARRATKVVTNSNNSRNDLLQFCDLDINKVSLVYWAVDETFLKPMPLSKNWPISDYILYVGSLEPRKNIRVLVEAYEKMRCENPTLKTKLVLIGGESPLFADVTFNIGKYKNDVILKGFVDEEELRGYYRHAKLVAYPSLYEGFGLPPLEAMASGTPVVTSSTSSLPEVVGDAAIKVNPYDVSGLAKAMKSVLVNKELRRGLITKGHEQVSRFNWYRVARNILAVYYEVYHSNEGATAEGQAHIPFKFWQKLLKIEEERIKSVRL